MHQPTTEEVLELFRARGGSRYGGESVSQLAHALQAAQRAENEGASPALIVAALVHDIGHLLHDLSEFAPDQGVDDVHENLGADWLAARFGPEVVRPVRLHVAAKRYLCAVDDAYFGQLSPPSVQSLKLQGGLMSANEVQQFESDPYSQDAARLRRWDDAAKIPGLVTPKLAHFARYLDAIRRPG